MIAIRIPKGHNGPMKLALGPLLKKVGMSQTALADAIGVSGPITVVASGVLIGNLGAPRAMSERTRAYFYGFWRLIDDLLNAALFVLLGLEVLVLHLQSVVQLSEATA